MMDFKESYKLQANQHKVSDAVLAATKDKMRHTQKSARHFSMKTIVFAAVLVACMGVTTFAYEYRQNQQFYNLINNNAGGNHDYRVNEDDQSQIIEGNDSMANVRVSLKEIKADYNNMYLTVELRTIDGSELNTNTENTIAVLEGQKFEKAYFTVDDTNVDFTSVMRTDDGSDATVAVFELWYSDTTSYTHTFLEPGKALVPLKTMQGKDIKIVLENYGYTVIKTQIVNFKFPDIGTMLENVELSTENQKIYFSDKYPETYIDKVEIRPDGGLNYDCLCITIVPESEAVRAELATKLAIINTETGKMIVSTSKIDGDSDKLEFAFFAGRGTYNEITKGYSSDTTVELLKKFVFTLRNGNELQTFNGKWKINFNLEKVNQMLTYEPNAKAILEYDNIEYVINKIELSDSNISIVGTIPPKFSLSNRNKKVYLIMSDGTRIDVGNKISIGYNVMTGGALTMNGYLTTLVDADDVVAIDVFGNYIELK